MIWVSVAAGMGPGMLGRVATRGAGSPSSSS